MTRAESKRRIAHEIREFLIVFLFLAPFFMSFATFRTYVVGEPGSWYFNYGTALVNALILAKIIVIGELAGLGKRSEDKALIFSTLHKAVAFTLLAMAFHAIEGTVRGVLHGQTAFAAFYGTVVTDKGEFLGRGLVLFFGALPFFALREVRRVMGEDPFHRLFFGRGFHPS
jgi:hypothetical protein